MNIEDAVKAIDMLLNADDSSEYQQGLIDAIEAVNKLKSHWADAQGKKLQTAIFRLCVIEDSPNLNEDEKALVRGWIEDLRA